MTQPDVPGAGSDPHRRAYPAARAAAHAVADAAAPAAFRAEACGGPSADASVDAERAYRLPDSDEFAETRSMRIVYVTETYPPELNGVALTVERTVRYLRGRGHVVQLIRPRQASDPGRGEARESAAQGHAARDGGEWLTAGWPIPVYPEMRFGFARASTLRRRFADFRPDLVHLATPGPLAWEALRAARALGVPATADFRTNFHHYSDYYHLGALRSAVLALLRGFHNRANKTFVPTHQAFDELTASGFHDLAVVGRGVDTDRFNPARRSAELRAAWGAAGDAPVLLTVGRVAAEKNIHLALRAFERLRRDRPDAQMVVVGDGPLRQRLTAEHPQVRFIGTERGERLAACYASADVFVFPSLSETFGNVTLEALASGLLVVAYDVAAAAEHAEQGVSGLLVPPGDEDGFVAAVAQIVANPQRWPAMQAHAVAAARRAQWSEVLAGFEQHLEDTRHATQAPIAAAAVVA